MNALIAIASSLALLASYPVSADCTAFPVQVSVTSIDPRFNITYDEAVASVQSAINYLNASIDRQEVALGNNGIPISFEWNDVSAAMTTLRNTQNRLGILQNRINELRDSLPSLIAQNASEFTIKDTNDQIGELTDEYNTGFNTVNTIRMQANNETLGVFTRVLTYASIKIFGFDSASGLTHILMHEMGHMLGLGHSSGNVMDPHTNNFFFLSAADAAKLRAEYDGLCNNE